MNYTGHFVAFTFAMTIFLPNNLLKLAQEMSLMNYTGEVSASNLKARTLLLAVFLIYSQKIPPKQLSSKTLLFIRPYSSFYSNLYPNPPTTPDYQKFLMLYIKIYRNLRKVPVTDGQGLCHYRVVTKTLRHLIFSQKHSSIFLMI